MPIINSDEIMLEIAPTVDMTAVIAAMAEKFAMACGMQAKEALALTLAVEEVFSYLCTSITEKEKIRIYCKQGQYYLQVDFVFPGRNINLRAFNLTTDFSFEDENQLNEIGLLIAARTVDRLYFTDDALQGMRLSLYKEKEYPAIHRQEAGPWPDSAGFTINKAAGEDIKSFCQMVVDGYEPHAFPAVMTCPGKLIDMVNSGDYHAAMAFDQQQQVRGGIVWRFETEKTVELFGPYLFTEAPEMAEALLEHCLEQVGRSEAVGMINLYGMPAGNGKLFEELGSTVLYGEDGSRRQNVASYRQLVEDSGITAWVHPDLYDYLHNEYLRLFLPRDLRTVTDMGEANRPYSVFSAAFDRQTVIMRPLQKGMDAEKNIYRHLQLFDREKIVNIFFEIDLGIPWQAGCIPSLLSNHFKPCFILPQAGRGDLLRLQYQAGDAQ
jgi:anti-sigma regulatory factor (Ser/Thr protein kinase)